MTDEFEERLTELLAARSRAAEPRDSLDAVVAAGATTSGQQVGRWRRATRRPLLAVAGLVAIVAGGSWWATRTDDATTVRTTSGAASASPTTAPAVPSSLPPSSTLLSSNPLSSTSSAPSTTVARDPNVQRCATGAPDMFLMTELDFVDGVTARTYVERRTPLSSGALLQLDYQDGRHSETISVETADLMSALALGDGRVVVVVGNQGNTGRAVGLVIADGCNLTRITGADGKPFAALMYGTGLGCAPACYPSVCLQARSPLEVVVRYAELEGRVPGSGDVPALSDDLVYRWTAERFQLRDTAMISVDRQAGTSRLGDLPVPKLQGVTCG